MQRSRKPGPFRHYEMWSIYNICASIMPLPWTDVTYMISPSVHICVLSVSVWKREDFPFLMVCMLASVWTILLADVSNSSLIIGVIIISTMLARNWVFCWDFWKPEQVYSFKPIKCGGSPVHNILTLSSEIKKEEEREHLNIMLIQDFPLTMNQATVWVIFHPMPLDDTLCRGDHKYLKRKSFFYSTSGRKWVMCGIFPSWNFHIWGRQRKVAQLRSGITNARQWG